MNVATDSDGHAGGGHVNGLGRRHRPLRGTPPETRHPLRAGAGRASALAGGGGSPPTLDHRIANDIERRAERTGRGIALEGLKGIRDRIRARRSQRGALHNWAFSQLKQMILYKAVLTGVPVNPEIDPRNTSRQCPRCGHTSKRNRRSQARFRCVGCA